MARALGHSDICERSILGRSATTRRAGITHATMEKGSTCGKCHGKAAFNFDDCTMCHAM